MKNIFLKILGFFQSLLCNIKDNKKFQDKKMSNLLQKVFRTPPSYTEEDIRNLIENNTADELYAKAVKDAREKLRQYQRNLTEQCDS